MDMWHDSSIPLHPLNTKPSLLLKFKSYQFQMPPPKDPITYPVIISVDNGAIKLTTTIDPETAQHTVNCDPCGQTLKI